MGSALLAGAATLYVSSSGASFSGASPPATSVAIYTPDGGPLRVGVDDSVRLDVNATTAPGTYLAVAGSAGGARLEVDIPGTVALSASSLAALNGRFCTPGGQGKEGVANTVVGIPPIPGDGGTGAQQGRTSISVTYPNQPGTGYVSCFASGLDGGTDPVCTLPTAGATTVGFRVDEGGSAELEISDAYVLRCLNCLSDGTISTATAVISYIETDCNQ